VLEELEKALQRGEDNDAVNQYLPDMVKLLQDDNTCSGSTTSSQQCSACAMLQGLGPFQ